jgi:hypothetical protein
VNPGAVGSNAYDARITRDGEGVDVQNVRLRFSLPEAGLYSAPLLMDNAEPGLWVSASGDVDRAAMWQVFVDFRPPDSPPLRAAFEWPIVAEVSDQNARSAGILNWISAASILAVILVWSGPRALRLTAHLDITPENMVVALMALALTVAVSVAGFLLVRDSGRTVREQRDSPPELINPVFADQEQLVLGRALYESDCLPCHGADGRGFRPLALGFSRRMPQLPEVLYERGDEDIYRILENGLVNRHFFASDYSSDNKWRLILFLRSLQ